MIFLDLEQKTRYCSKTFLYIYIIFVCLATTILKQDGKYNGKMEMQMQHMDTHIPASDLPLQEWCTPWGTLRVQLLSLFHVDYQEVSEDQTSSEPHLWSPPKLLKCGPSANSDRNHAVWRNKGKLKSKKLKAEERSLLGPYISLEKTGEGHWSAPNE